VHYHRRLWPATINGIPVSVVSRVIPERGRRIHEGWFSVVRRGAEQLQALLEDGGELEYEGPVFEHGREHPVRGQIQVRHFGIIALGGTGEFHLVGRPELLDLISRRPARS
jgi:hypothetical protein